MRSSPSASRLGRRTWLRSGAVAVAAAGAVALISAPSQAITVPPTGNPAQEVIRIYYAPPDMTHPVGTHIVVPCPGQPASPPDWGDQTGVSRLETLPCPTTPGPAPVDTGSAVTLLSAPSQASNTPPPRDVSMLVRVFYLNDKAQPLGEHFITACPGQPLMQDWGVQTGTSYLIDLPCTTPVPPPGDPS